MQNHYFIHNRYKQSAAEFDQYDPHLQVLAELKYQYSPEWWVDLDLTMPGVYILTGGRQVGKSTSCKLLIKKYLSEKYEEVFKNNNNIKMK